jgi:STE24 endopeptidase
MDSAHLIFKVFLTLLALQGLIDAWLDRRNRRHVLAHRDQVPEKFRDSITLSEHQRAADYTIAKLKTGQFFSLLDLGILLLWTIGGAFNALDYFAKSFNFGPIATAMIFFAGMGAISTLIGLPKQLYTTFVIEERFGFNRTTKKLFIIDLVRGLVLGAVIGLPILAGLVAIIEGLGEKWWIWGFVFTSTVQFIIVWAYPRFIAPLFNKFSPLAEGEVKERVLKLLGRTGFSSQGLFVMDASKRSSHGNAYFTGFGKNKRIVFFDNLIKSLDAGEVEAVLAHELGHFKLKHVTMGLVRSLLISLIAFYLMGHLFTWPAFFAGHGVSTQSTHLALALFAAVGGVYTFFLGPIFALLSRKQEFAADAFAAQYAEASSLANALVKLYKENASTLTPDPLYSAFHYSHPPALERIKELEALGAK